MSHFESIDLTMIAMITGGQTGSWQYCDTGLQRLLDGSDGRDKIPNPLDPNNGISWRPAPLRR